MRELLRLCLVFCLIELIAASTWTYSDPSHWGDYCGGSKQSPININTEAVEYNRELGQFVLSGWGLTETAAGSGEGATYTIVNNGHTLQVNVGSGKSISGAGLSGEYIMAQLHFHWGSGSSKGSEHAVDGKIFPMELHLVHYKSEYGSLTNALGHDDGLAVMGFLFTVGSKNANYDKLISHFDDVTKVGGTTSIPAFALDTMIPSDIRGYYRYDGSLTTPPCSEVVTWSLFHNTIQLSEDQLNEFRTLYGSEGKLEDNFRPVQSLNDRTVFTSLDNDK